MSTTTNAVRSTETPARLGGVVKCWFAEKGYGFITIGDPELRRSLGRDHFVHISAVNGSGDLCVGAVVTFELERDGHGRSRAVRVEQLTGR